MHVEMNSKGGDVIRADEGGVTVITGKKLKRRGRALSVYGETVLLDGEIFSLSWPIDRIWINGMGRAFNLLLIVEGQYGDRYKIYTTERGVVMKRLDKDENVEVIQPVMGLVGIVARNIYIRFPPKDVEE
jgi:hypothetical protein